jgi:octaprenyl-diphosphate synthase
MEIARKNIQDQSAELDINETFDLIKDDLDQVEIELKKNLKSEVYLITKVGEYILKSGGKRFRPSILLLSAKLSNYHGHRHIPLASIIEFIHTATLLHDDVIDNAKLRRGKESANSVWGNGASVLIGDFLFSKSFNLMVADKDLKILQVVANTTTYMAEGEVLQLMKGKDIDTTEEEYISVVEKKTASLISAACRMGAILGKTSAEKEQALAGFGTELGTAFQLMDDCLDYKSEDTNWGKAIGNDLKEGKVTLPLLHTLKSCSDKERDQISKVIGDSDLEEECLIKTIELIDKYDGINYTKGKARSHIKNAKNFLNTFDDCMWKTALSTIADFVVERRN